MLRLSSTHVLIMYLPLFLCLSCWLWASMYCWNRESFMSNLLCFTLQLIFNFMTLIHVSAPSFCHSRENFVFHSCLRMLYKKKLFWVKSNLWSRQDKTIEIYSCSDYWFMWKIFIQSSTLHKYVWAVLCLCILMSSNISGIYMTAYFVYFSDILNVLHNHSLSAPYHLTWWQKQSESLFLNGKLLISTFFFCVLVFFLIVRFHHVTYTLRESTLCNCADAKKLLAWNRYNIWNSSDCNGTWTYIKQLEMMSCFWDVHILLCKEVIGDRGGRRLTFPIWVTRPPHFCCLSVTK